MLIAEEKNIQKPTSTRGIAVTWYTLVDLIRKPTAWRLVPLCHFFLIEKLPFPKSQSILIKKLQSILKLFDYPRDCRGKIVWNTLLPESNELCCCFCDQSSTEALKWALEFFGRKILNSVTDCGDKIIVP